VDFAAAYAEVPGANTETTRNAKALLLSVVVKEERSRDTDVQTSPVPVITSPKFVKSVPLVEY
jgi:hypothetical protein